MIWDSNTQANQKHNLEWDLSILKMKRPSEVGRPPLPSNASTAPQATAGSVVQQQQVTQLESGGSGGASEMLAPSSKEDRADHEAELSRIIDDMVRASHCYSVSTK